MQMIVIGGTGFIGQFLVPQLVEAGHAVTVVQRPASERAVPAGVRTVRADRRDLAASARALREVGADVVMDLILSSGAQAAQLMEVFRGHVARVVAASSIDVYRATGVLHGLEDGGLEPLPLTEASPLRRVRQTYPDAQIAVLKRLFGWVDASYDKIDVEREVLGDDALPGTVLRLPMIYGPGDVLHRFKTYLKRMDDGRPAIVLPDSLAAWRSPRGYVENVAAALALAAVEARAAGRFYNVAEEEGFSELEWAQMIAATAGWDGDFVLVPDEEAPPAMQVRGDLRQHWVVDTTRIRAELGYVEPLSRADAMRRTVAWERSVASPSDAPLDYAGEDDVLRRAQVE